MFTASNFLDNRVWLCWHELEGVKNPATWHVPADHEFLPEVCPHLDQVTSMRRGVISLWRARTVKPNSFLLGSPESPNLRAIPSDTGRGGRYL